MDAATVVSLIVGGWGAALATALAVRQVRRDRQREQRAVTVRCQTALLQQKRGAFLFEVVVVSIVNEGHRPVEIRSVHFRLDSGEDIYGIEEFGEPTLPKALGDGNSVVVHFGTGQFDGLENEGRSAEWAVVTDASGTEYVGDWPSPHEP